MNTILLIDGENFKNYIKYSLNNNKKDITWSKYNFKGLFGLVLDGYDINKVIFYFAKLKKYKQTEKKSMILIEQQRLLKTHLENQGFDVIFAGRVKRVSRRWIFG